MLSSNKGCASALSLNFFFFFFFFKPIGNNNPDKFESNTILDNLYGGIFLPRDS